jgi:hypothetical protein
MAKNGLATLYDDNGYPVATTLTGKTGTGAPFGALCVSDIGTPILMTTGGTLTTAIAAGASSAAVKAAPGRLCKALVTTAGTATDNITIYDNASAASGTVIGIIPGGTAVGTMIEFNMPAANGIYAVNVASGPAVTLSYV